MRGASAWRDSKVQSEVEFFAIPFLTLTISPREKILSVCVLDIGERTSSLEDIENDAPG
jgi:ABC-type antimicrobial peptide transport system permease subunit